MGLTEGAAATSADDATESSADVAEDVADAMIETPAEAGLEATRNAAARPEPKASEPAPGAEPDEPVAAEPSPPLPELGSSPGQIEITDTLATAGRKAMWVHLERLLSRERAMADPATEPDVLRRYRVAVRRLRAAIRMFGPAYADAEIKPLRRGLQELARVVGGVRDLDLRIADLDRWSRERGEGSVGAVMPLLAAWSAQRERAVAALAAHLATKRHRRLLVSLAAFVEARPVRPAGRGSMGRPVLGDRLGSTLWGAYEEVRDHASIIRWADVPALHRVRVSAKRLRDDVEFLGDVLGPSRDPLVERLVALQDHLGAMNDAAVTAAAVREFLEGGHGGLAPHEQAEIAAYLTDREREVARLKRSTLRPWRPVAGITFARRLGRLVVVPAASRTPPRRSASS